MRLLFQFNTILKSSFFIPVLVLNLYVCSCSNSAIQKTEKHRTAVIQEVSKRGKNGKQKQHKLNKTDQQILVVKFEDRSSHKTKQLRNLEYTVNISSGGIISYTNLRFQKKDSVNIDACVFSAEICKSAPFLSISTCRDKNGDITYIIIDLINKTMHSNQFTWLDLDERRWSNDGEHAFFRYTDGARLVPTDKLRMYLRGDSLDEFVFTLVGHPAGDTFQLGWTDDGSLIYGSGVGEIFCHGLLDPHKRKNFFLGCCVVGNPLNKVKKCETNERDFLFLYQKFIKDSNSGKAVEISLDFWNEAYRQTIKN